MAENDLEYVKKQLPYCNLKRIAEETGLPYMTVYNLANGITVKPHFETVQILADFFRSQQ